MSDRNDFLRRAREIATALAQTCAAARDLAEIYADRTYGEAGARAIVQAELDAAGIPGTPTDLTALIAVCQAAATFAGNASNRKTLNTFRRDS
jgi:hypothetical protein